ncbi:MAG: capsule assembly Wzi family protein [Bacteroidales bacterium]
MRFILSEVKLIFFLAATIVLFSSSCIIYGQVKVPEWNIGLNAVGGIGNQAPFWIISNRQGRFLPEKYAGSMELGLFTYKDTNRIIDYDYGLNLYGRLGEENDYWFHQAYAGITLYDFVRLRIGMQEETGESKEPYLSTGAVMWSGNARPMPKIEVGTPGYVPVPFTYGYLEMKGLIAHGWFEEGRYASNVLLHQKNAYARLGGSLPVRLYYGFNHYAQWAGSSPRQEEPYPSDFKSFVKVFFNRSGDKNDPGTPDGWAINRFGNSLGSQHYGIDFDIANFNAGIYQQDIFEDGSGMRKQNFPDGIWGAWLRFPENNRIIQAFVYEFLHTTNQSGPYHDIEGDTLGGNDNYFNHGHYSSGWTYHKYTIGTPFITSPLLNDPASFRIRNNRVIAHHFGFEGYITPTVTYRNLITFSRNFGTYSIPFQERRDQLSWMLEIAGPINYFNLEASITIAADKGEMYGDNAGVLFSIKKNGIFFKK